MRSHPELLRPRRRRVLGLVLAVAVGLAVSPSGPVVGPAGAGADDSTSRVGNGTGAGAVTSVDGFVEQVGASHDGRRVAEPIRAPQPFTMVGIEAPVGARAEVRASADGATWSSWVTVEPVAADGPTEGSAEESGAAPGERFSEPVWVGTSAWVQVAVHGAAVGDLTAHLVDPGALDAAAPQPLTTASFTTAVPAPPIVSRAAWGADESLRSGAPRYADAARYAVVHHTASTNSYTAAEAPAVVRSMYRYHTEVLHWDDIGYNLLVDRFGTVYEGRAGGVDKPVIGAHAGGFNTGSIGVSVIGEFTAQAPPAVAQGSLAAVLAWKLSLHGIDPAGRLTVTSGGSPRYAAGVPVVLPTIVGHRDVGLTACPGDAFYALLPALRQRVADAAGGSVVLPPPPPPTPPSGPFLDIAGSPHAESIVRLQQAGIVRGCAEDLYCPDRAVSRAEAATLLVRASARFDPLPGATFVDVPAGHPHAGAVNALAAAGVIKGFADRRFRPDDALSRAQMAMVLARALGLELVWGVRFVDVPLHEVQFRPRINAVAGAGLTTGCTADRFCPSGTTTRGQMATFVARAIDRGL